MPKVYVGVSYNRDNETHVCGVATTAIGAASLVEIFREEPLFLDHHNCLNNYPKNKSDPPDIVGSVIPFDLMEEWYPTRLVPPTS